MARQNRRVFDADKFEQALQVGGIRTGSIDHPQPGGGRACRVAFVDTGSGLRFTVALDRGGDIVDASFNDTNLAYLTPNGYTPPEHAYHREAEWLTSWPGGLLTTCGPGYMGAPRVEGDTVVSLHGRHANTPAAVTAITQPDPAGKSLEMSLELLIRDTRFLGPHYETRRTLSATLGEPTLRVRDRVTNRGDERVPHGHLYHCNLGYPLLDRGARMIYRGKLDAFLDRSRPPTEPAPDTDPDTCKKIPSGLPEHAGAGERCLIMEVTPDRRGLCRIGLLNPKIPLAVELTYSPKQMPRMTNWQHFGPAGSYVTALEPFNGSLVGTAQDKHPKAKQWLRPGQSRTYDLAITVHHDDAGIADLLKNDGPVRR